ncbi:MAG: hypothetical protein COX65_04205 [Elusimicrobia bacterium CG_4_10_14_0_2_um_filter_56_8]|nr:MAG: hypothetical protein COX65_04205 [Elusimicrobia bacterium CG_4_10_14_0_2_um_filter_56_8]
MAIKTGSFKDKHFARLIQRTLLGGVFICLALIVTGASLGAAGHPSGPALLRYGLLALVLTPAARVIMLVYGYWRGGEYYFALASLVVLALLASSLFV